MSSRTITTLFWWTSDLLQLWQNRPILKQGVWERHRAVVSTCDQSWIPTQVCSHLPSRKISTLTSCPSELLQLWQKRPILNTWVYSPTITFTFMCRMCSFEVSSLQTDKKNPVTSIMPPYISCKFSDTFMAYFTLIFMNTCLWNGPLNCYGVICCVLTKVSNITGLPA